MTPLFDTKKPHEPHVLCLDEGLSGPKLCGLMREATLSVVEYHALGLEKNQKVEDDLVLEKACAAGYVLVTTDHSIETDSIEAIIKHKARIIILTDKHGGVVNLAAALICSKEKCNRTLLDCPVGPLVIRINRAGGINKVRGENELIARCERIVSRRIALTKKIQFVHKKLQA